MIENFQQEMTGAMTFPRRGTLNRTIFKTPLVLWRLGLGSFLGKHMLVLSTWGRVSKAPRHTMLSYYEYNDSFYVLSGWGEKSDWYQNMRSNPAVALQTDKVATNALARRVESLGEYRPVMQALLDGGGDSHFEPWLESLDIQESIDDLVAKRERVYLVALDPCGGSGPIQLESDLKWVWGALILILGIGFLMDLLKRKKE